MLTAYYQLLHLHDEYNSLTVTINAFGQHLDIYCNREKLGIVPYSERDKRCLMAYNWGNTHPLSPYIPAEHFLRSLALDAA